MLRCITLWNEMKVIFDSCANEKKYIFKSPDLPFHQASYKLKNALQMLEEEEEIELGSLKINDEKISIMNLKIKQKQLLCLFLFNKIFKNICNIHHLIKDQNIWVRHFNIINFKVKL